MTKIIQESDPDSLDLACTSLREGKIISFFCDTVYGLAVDASNSDAVESLYQIKSRNKRKPIVIFLKDLAEAKKIFYFDEIAEKIAEQFLPGNLTIILKTHTKSSASLSPNLNYLRDQFLGFRIPKSPFINQLLKKFNGILAVTSANPSSQKAATNANDVEKYFSNSNLKILIDSGAAKGTTEGNTASTIIRIHDKKISILRHGAIASSEIMNYEKHRTIT